MNHALRLRTLSSGLRQGKNKKDNRQNVYFAGDVSNFLLRRRLFTLENKRIKTALVEIEADIKARRDHLGDIRERVRASLHGHLALRQKALREELAAREGPQRREKIRNLPKTAERFIRRMGQRFFASLGSGSARVTDSSDAVRALAWRLPEVRQLDAWAEWFAESRSALLKAARFRKDRIQVALVVGGGLGDLLKSTQLAGPIADHFSCDLTIVAAQGSVGEILAHNPYVRDTIVPVSQNMFGVVEQLRHIPVFDLIAVWTYGVQYIIPPGSRIAREDIPSIDSGSPNLRRLLEEYCFLHGWPQFNFALSRDATRLGLSVTKLSVATSGLPCPNPHEIPFFVGKQSVAAISELLTKRYVTVHHGFDLNCLPVKTRTTDYSSTKNLSMEQWRQIVSLIRNEGVEVVQLGIAEEEKIDGVTQYLNGLTSVEESGLLIKHSLCHIDTEGGLVHLARAVHARSVVAFGPTPVEFFGYPQNVNLEPSGCKACWFTTQNWVIECPRHTSGPECMRGHSATDVAEAASRIIAESENFAAKLIGAETRSSLTRLAQAVATARTLLGDEAAARVLLILDDLPCDIGSELSDGVVGGNEVIICADKPRGAGLGDRAEYGSLLNLPRASSSIDAAIWISHELEPDTAPFALREIFRILKPGGRLFFAALGESPGLDLPQALRTARIGFDGGEPPSAPIYSCSLRKSEVQRDGVEPRSRQAVSARNPATSQRQSNADDPRLAPLEEENARQIAVVRDKFDERQRLGDEVLAVVDSAVQRGFGQDGWIWVSNGFAEGYATKFFISGWDSALDWVIWSRENSVLVLPLPEEQSSGVHRLELQLHLTLPETSAANPMTIGVRVDDGPTENFRLSTDDEILTVLAPTDSSRFRGLSQVELRLGGAKGERADFGMRMGVRRFRYRYSGGEGEQASVRPG